LLELVEIGRNLLKLLKVDLQKKKNRLCENFWHCIYEVLIFSLAIIQGFELFQQGV